MTGTFDGDRAVRRIRLLTRWMAGLVAIGLFVFKDASWGLGFLVGAALSMLSFEVLHRFALGAGAGAKPSQWKFVLAGARYILIAAIVYVMMKSFGLNILAIICGLLITAGAVLLEILYEFIHGT